MIHQNSIANYGEPGYFKHRAIRSTAKFGAALYQEMYEHATANHLFSKAEAKLAEELAEEKRKHNESIRISQLCSFGPKFAALLVESRESIGGDWRERRDLLLREAGAIGVTD